MKRTGFLTIVVLLLAGISAPAQVVKDDKGLLKQQAITTRKSKSLGVLSGTWWRTSPFIKYFDLTADQQKKMDDVFQDARVRLITLDADLRVQEATLDPLMSAERLDEAKALAQIDRVAQARAELEKANARMLLGLRKVMTAEQWDRLQKLQSGFKGPEPAFLPTK